MRTGGSVMNHRDPHAFGVSEAVSARPGADPAGEPMTCGYAVNEAVDNPAHAWITAVIVWITKKISVAFLGRLRRAGLKE